MSNPPYGTPELDLALEKHINTFYPISIHQINDEGDIYYVAHHPDFGHSACSAPGPTPQQAIKALVYIKEHVIRVYLETGRLIPKPSQLDDPSDKNKSLEGNTMTNKKYTPRKTGPIFGEFTKEEAVQGMNAQTKLGPKISDLANLKPEKT